MEQELLIEIPVMEFPLMNFEDANFMDISQSQELDF